MDKNKSQDQNKGIAYQALIDMLPLSIAVIPWGVLTGALAVQAGFSPLQAQVLSLIVFAGAAQLSSITQLASGVTFASIFVSTFVISSRHLLYSLSFRQHVSKCSFLMRTSIAFLLTDEMFAVSETHTKRSGAFSPKFALVSGFFFYLSWNIATAFGIALVSLNLNKQNSEAMSAEGLDALGLEFAIVATFIAMTFSALRRFPVVIAILLSAIIAILTKPFFPNSYIVIAALVGMLAAYACDNSNTNISPSLEEE